jgi:hypothetical protein
MTKEQAEREKRYAYAMALADILLCRGIIGKEGFCAIETKISVILRPLAADIYPE